MIPADYSKGNPRAPPPRHAKHTIVKGRKRLIILCDGSFDESISVPAQYPTNITRLARAISSNAWVQTGTSGKYENIEQITFYLGRRGTSFGGRIRESLLGIGLSALARDAYGFLANNYNDGDVICVFGFSYGAYVARSIASMVADHGILTKRGMDNFVVVYNSCCNTEKNFDSEILVDGMAYRPEELGLKRLPRGTVEVVGAFDTIEFCGSLKIFRSTKLSENIKYAFHAMALDETQASLQTTLFFQATLEPSEEAQLVAKKGWRTTLKQVWFSGQHADVGGVIDSRLSNIPLVWMISELVYHNLLEFDQNYLVDESEESCERWETADGPTPSPWIGLRSQRPAGKAINNTIVAGKVWIFKNILRASARARIISGVRTPGSYAPSEYCFKKDEPNIFQTNEEIHASIADRRLTYSGPGSEYSVLWPCKPLDGALHCKYRDGTWQWFVQNPEWKATPTMLRQTVNTDIETFFRGRIRDPMLLSPIETDETWAKPITLPPTESWV